MPLEVETSGYLRLLSCLQYIYLTLKAESSRAGLSWYILWVSDTKRSGKRPPTCKQTLNPRKFSVKIL
jgi:hypothetical protein